MKLCDWYLNRFDNDQAFLGLDKTLRLARFSKLKVCREANRALDDKQNLARRRR